MNATNIACFLNIDIYINRNLQKDRVEYTNEGDGQDKGKRYIYIYSISFIYIVLVCCLMIASCMKL